MLTSTGAVRKVSPYHQFPSNTPIAITWLHRQRVAQQPASDLIDLVLRRGRQLSPKSSIWWSLALSAHSTANGYRPFTSRWLPCSEFRRRSRLAYTTPHSWLRPASSSLQLSTLCVHSTKYRSHSKTSPKWIALTRWVLSNSSEWSFIDCVLRGHNFWCDYVSDIQITSKAKEELIQHLEEVFPRKDEHGLVFNSDMSTFCQKNFPSSPSQSQISSGLSTASRQASPQTFPL